MHATEHGAPERTLLHISDTHLRGPGERLFSSIDGAESLGRALRSIEQAHPRIDAIVFTGDLADLGEASAYARLRAMAESFAERIGARIIWVMGNHDDRSVFRAALLDDRSANTAPIDRVDELDGLRVVTLDTAVPGEHYGEIVDAQLEWLASVLREPAPLGTILAMHHPPVPAVLPLAASVELRDQRRLAGVLRGSDVRAIIAGHLHYSTFATFAGIPVSVASSTCYTQDLTVPSGGSMPQDGGRSVNLVQVFEDTVVHSIVGMEPGRTLEHIDAEEARRRLADAGIAPRESTPVLVDA